MPRVTSALTTSPTFSLRINAWLLIVDNILRKNCQKRIADPLSNSKRTEILTNAILRLSPEEKAKASSLIPMSGKIKWSEWLSGRHIPSGNYIELMNMLVPGSRCLLETDVPPLPTDIPLAMLVYVIEQWSSAEPDEAALTRALQTIHSMWRPVKRENDSRQYWSMNILPEKRIMPSIFLESYRVLEPTSITSFMLRLTNTVEFHSDQRLFKRWVFDLVSAALVTAAFLRCQKARGIGLGGPSEDAATCVLYHFLEYELMADQLGKELSQQVKEADLIRTGTELKPVTILDVTAATTRTLVDGKALFISELSNYGITVDRLLHLLR